MSAIGEGRASVEHEAERLAVADVNRIALSNRADSYGRL